MNRARDTSVLLGEQTQRLAAEGMADIVQRQGLIALAHPGHRGGGIERRPVRHRGFESNQRFKLVVAGHRLLPAVAGAAVIIGQHRAAAPREIAGEPLVDPARGRRWPN